MKNLSALLIAVVLLAVTSNLSFAETTPAAAPVATNSVVDANKAAAKDVAKDAKDAPKAAKKKHAHKHHAKKEKADDATATK